jgi:hypothetical protein
MSTTPFILTADTTTNIVVGKIATDTEIVLTCVCRRGALYSIGRCVIAAPTTIYVVAAPVFEFWEDDVGIAAITADILGADIRLNLTVDSSSTDNVSFDWNKLTIKGTKV